jgi:hypothetical protein
LEELSEKFETRLKELFEKKDKWTLRELKHFMKELNIGNLEEKLARHCKIIPEPNPFDSKKTCLNYMLKFKIY